MLSLIKAQKKQRKTSPDIKRGKLLALVLRVVLASACAAPDALAGKCHRHWCARLLVEAGWEVEQDGKRILSEFSLLA